ncbi:Beta carbonic anhydrase 1 [Atta colombica]|uniref:Carbonic anhydrase n=1 Tax=Atta colombica TaxID=520822 RepID=A0A151I1X9_9HYME|nr:Beta carbonic anhydrase 1 [Atta colombica]
MDRILKGIMNYRKCHREGMVKQFKQVKDHPEPKAVFFTCMDSRMIPTRFTETNIGDMFVGTIYYSSIWPNTEFIFSVRNPGNVIPHSHHFMDEFTMCEAAALELGCVVNDIRHIIVCGHSDCKAMNLLYALRDKKFASQANRRMSPLKAWLYAHASSSLTKFQHLEITGFREPILFQGEMSLRKFVAYIDPEDKFAIEDKLSQINTLQQLQNISSYGFLKKRLERHDLHIHALWFDIYTGDIYYFSRANKRFIEINETTEPLLLKEINKYYS